MLGKVLDVLDGGEEGEDLVLVAHEVVEGLHGVRLVFVELDGDEVFEGVIGGGDGVREAFG